MSEIKADDPVGSGSLVYALKERAPRLAMAFAASQAAMPLIKKARRWLRERSTYTITVDGGDKIYDDLHEWLLAQLPSDARRALVAFSSARQGSGHDEPLTVDEERIQPPRIHLRYDGSRPQTLNVDGHRVKVEMTEPEGMREGGAFFILKQPRIVFTVSSPIARDAVQDQMDRILLARHQAKNRPSLRIAKSWGDWARHDELPRRSLESVVLPAEQREALITDMERFLSMEAEYNRRFIPWHRGYLFGGPPGTGKTSIAKALANHFGLDVWYLPLGDVKSGSTLMQLVGNVSPRSLLLIEDIDVFHAAKERDDDNDVTLSDLLNALDGIATPHGLITVMTSNVPEVLDPALIRPGRVDRVEEFELANEEQIGRLFEWFYGRPFPAAIGIRGVVAPAEVVGVMHRHFHDPSAAALEIGRLTARALVPA